MGIEVELEHTADRALAKEIAKDHLTEMPDYYTRLQRMEREGEKAMRALAQKTFKGPDGLAAIVRIPQHPKGHRVEVLIGEVLPGHLDGVGFFNWYPSAAKAQAAYRAIASFDQADRWAVLARKITRGDDSAGSRTGNPSAVSTYRHGDLEPYITRYKHGRNYHYHIRFHPDRASAQWASEKLAKEYGYKFMDVYLMPFVAWKAYTREGADIHDAWQMSRIRAPEETGFPRRRNPKGRKLSRAERTRERELLQAMREAAEEDTEYVNIGLPGRSRGSATRRSMAHGLRHQRRKSSRAGTRKRRRNPGDYMQVAETIRRQIGHRAFVMMGAKEFMGGDGGLGTLKFKLGRGARDHITHVMVTLEPSDTYTVKFLRWRGGKRQEMETVAEYDDVYVDGLRELISGVTGFVLNL